MGGGKGTTVQTKEHWAWNQEIRFKSQHRVLIHHVVLGKLPGFAVLMGPRATNAFFLVEHHMTLRAGSSALRLNCDHTAPLLEGPNQLRPGRPESVNAHAMFPRLHNDSNNHHHHTL